MSDIYEKIFGKVKTGRGYSSDDSPTSRSSAASLRASMKKFRQFVHGGNAGTNLSAAEAELILNEIEPALKRLPAGKRLSSAAKYTIRQRLARRVRSGQLSSADFADAKKILDQF